MRSVDRGWRRVPGPLRAVHGRARSLSAAGLVRSAGATVAGGCVRHAQAPHLGEPRLVRTSLQFSLRLAYARAFDGSSDSCGRGNHDTVLRWHEPKGVRLGDAMVETVHALGIHEDTERARG